MKPKRVKKTVVPLAVRVNKDLFLAANKARVASGRTWVEIIEKLLADLAEPKGGLQRLKEKISG